MEIVDRRVPLSEIGKTVGPAPVTRFVGNVRRNGVVIPILLRETVSPEGAVEYRIVDGNRRVAAARMVGLRDIQARVFIGLLDDEAARLTLMANNFRSANDITEFWAIRHLERHGEPRQRIADDAGFDVRYLRLRDRWSTLDRRLFVGFAEGKIIASVADKLSRMPQDEQRMFGDMFIRDGRILTTEVQEHLQRRKASGRNQPARQRGVREGDGVHVTGAASGPVVTRFVDQAAADPAVTIVTSGPLPPSGNLATMEGAPRLPDDVQQVIEDAARLGREQGLPLSSLTDALATAYRRVASAGHLSKEETRG